MYDSNEWFRFLRNKIFESEKGNWIQITRRGVLDFWWVKKHIYPPQEDRIWWDKGGLGRAGGDKVDRSLPFSQWLMTKIKWMGIRGFEKSGKDEWNYFSVVTKHVSSELLQALYKTLKLWNVGFIILTGSHAGMKRRCTEASVQKTKRMGSVKLLENFYHLSFQNSLSTFQKSLLVVLILVLFYYYSKSVT